jgi:hypothetical protein
MAARSPYLTPFGDDERGRGSLYEKRHNFGISA